MALGTRGNRLPSSILNMKTEDFIEEVKKYPALWNKNIPAFKDRNSKRQAWYSMGQRFFDNFNDKEEVEKERIVGKFITRWKNIKDNFSKSCKRKNLGMTQVKEYSYDRQLSFLLDPPGHITYKHIIKGEDTFEEDDDISDQKSFSLPVPKKQRTNSFDTSPVEYVESHLNVEIDADLFFFKSLLPAMKNWQEEDKCDFKSDVINLVKQYTLKSKQNNQVECSSTKSLQEKKLKTRRRSISE